MYFIFGFYKIFIEVIFFLMTQIFDINVEWQIPS